MMFWNKRKDTKYPLNIDFTWSSVASVFRISFLGFVKIDSIYLRQTAGGIVSIYSDEAGDKLLSTGPQNSFIYMDSVSLISGTGTIQQAVNSVTLNNSFPNHYLDSGWRVRNLYLNSSVTGRQIVSFTYSID